MEILELFENLKSNNKKYCMLTDNAKRLLQIIPRQHLLTDMSGEFKPVIYPDLDNKFVYKIAKNYKMPLNLFFAFENILSKINSIGSIKGKHTELMFEDKYDAIIKENSIEIRFKADI